VSNKAPSPKTDALRALREERFNARSQAVRDAQADAQSEKPKPVKRQRRKE
jgi:hypothetical protein